MNVQYRALILDTILKELRSKTLIFIFVVTTIVILLSHAGVSLLNDQLAGQQNLSLLGGSVLSIIFRILNTLTFFIAVIFGVSTIRSDFQNNIIQQYLSFPISRSEYFFIRVLGTWILVLGYYVYAYVLSTILYSVTFQQMMLGPHHFYNFMIMAVYILLVIFISILFSMMMNKVGAFIGVFATSIVSSMAFRNFDNLGLAEYWQDFNVFKGIGLAIYWLFPRMEFLSTMSSQVLAQEAAKLASQQILLNSLHLLVISGIYIALASALVKRKNF